MNGQFLSLILVPKCISSRLTFSVLVKQWVLFSVQLLLWHILIIFSLCAVYWKESGSKPMCKHGFPADAAGTNFLNYNLRVCFVVVAAAAFFAPQGTPLLLFISNERGGKYFVWGSICLNLVVSAALTNFFIRFLNTKLLFLFLHFNFSWKLSLSGAWI